jgi:phosphoribosyl-ATP pyrophosphohydrolase
VIIPSIDLMGGQTVQLIGGREHALDAGDPRPIARRFGIAGEIAVVDLDAALGRGSNAPLVRDLLRRASCRVAGGIRDERAALEWLDAGAAKIVLGTAASPDLLGRLPRERIIAALDSRDGEVVVEGWRRSTGETVLERMSRLEGLVGGFLVTFVEREGRLGGTCLEQVPAIVAAAGDARVTIAGGITTASDVAALDAMGADAQVGMALYTERLDLGEAIAAPLRSDRPDGLWPTVVVDEFGRALGLAYSDLPSVCEAVRTGTGVYHSRARGRWVKGASSGNGQELLRVDLDCDRDTLRFVVRQSGSGFCHRGMRSCWGGDHGLPALASRIERALSSGTSASYTRRLIADAPLLESKLLEEAAELASARTVPEAVHEASDLFYFAMVALQRAGATLEDVESELDRRVLRITRRVGDAKPTPRVVT